MKKQLILSGVLALASMNANAQYYNQSQYSPSNQYTIADYRQRRQYVPQATYNTSQTSSNYYLRPYLGVSYAYSMFHFKSDTGDWFADKYNNLNFSAGLKLYKNFGIEASVQISDKQDKSENGYYGIIPATLNTEINYYAYALDAVGYFPVSNTVDLIGTFGGGIYVFDEKAKITRTSNGQVLEDMSDSETRFAPRLGLGMEFRLSNNFAAQIMARGAYLHYDDLDYIVDLQAGLRFYFR